MRQRAPYKRKADGGAVPADDAPVGALRPDGTHSPELSRIAAEMSAEAGQAPAPAAPAASHREGQFTKWREQGLSGAQAMFLSKNPHMADHPAMLATAAQAAKEACQENDIEPDTHEYFEVLRQTFDEFLKPAPKYFQPEGFESAPRERSAMVSAPVERTVPTGNYNDRGQIRLTPEQREAAAIAGVSESLYAEQLLRLREAKEAGHYQGQP